MKAEQTTWGARPPGYRLPSAAHPGSVSLQVADLGRSVEFYEHVLGMRADVDGRTASLFAGNADNPLIRLIERAGATPVPRQGRLGLYHFALLLPDRPSLGRFLGHMADLSIRVGMSDHLVSEAVYLSDPDGLGIEVYADRPRDEWRRRGNELAMTTEPLNAQELIAAGGGRWEAMPPATVLGHIHLFVADLEVAEDFYHRALGLDKMVWSYPGALFMSAGGYHHHLGVNTWAAGAPRAGDDDARLLEWSLVLPRDAALDEIKRSLADNGYGSEVMDGGLVARDPWGTQLRLVTP